MYRTGMVDRKRMSNSMLRQKLFDLEALKTLASGTLQHITAQHWKYMDVWSLRMLMPGRLGAKKEPILERKTPLLLSSSLLESQQHLFISHHAYRPKTENGLPLSTTQTLFTDVTNQFPFSIHVLPSPPSVQVILSLILSQQLCFSLM